MRMMALRFPEDLIATVRNFPQRNVTSLNVYDDVKAQADFLHSWWELETGQVISQPDAVRILLFAAVDNPRLSVPPGFRERLARMRAEVEDESEPRSKR